MTRTAVPPRWPLWAVLGLLALGFWLRVWALNYGLPGIYNPDETPILNRALALAKGDPNPHNFLYPSLYFYALFGWEVLFFLAGRVAGLWHSLDVFQQEYFTDPSRLVLAGRTLTALLGTLLVAAVYRFGRQLYDVGVGVAAAAFVAVSPFLVRDSHYIKLDVPVTLLNTLAHLAIARLVVDPGAGARRGPWIAAGLLTGLAISTQYYVVFTVVSIAAVALADVRRSSGWQRPARWLAWAALATVAGFLIGTPFILAEPQTAIQDIAGVRQVDIDRALAGGGGPFTSLAAYLRMLATDAMGAPVFVAALVGMAVALATDWRRALPIVVFPVCYMAFISHTVPMSRYLDAMLPMIAVTAGVGVVRIGALAGTRATAASAVLIATASIPGLALSIRSDRFFGQKDTRTLAREYIERELPPGASVLTQPYSAPIRMSRDALVEALRSNLGDESRASIKFQLQLAVSPAPAYRTIYYGDGGTDPDKMYLLPAEVERSRLEALHRLRIEYVVLKRTNVPNPETAALEATLAQHADRLATFSPYRGGHDVVPPAVAPFLHNTASRIDPALERPGPIVDVWRVR